MTGNRKAMCGEPFGTAAARYPFATCGFTKPCPVHDGLPPKPAVPAPSPQEGPTDEP